MQLPGGNIEHPWISGCKWLSSSAKVDFPAMPFPNNMEFHWQPLAGG
jgi:hypothetical protein